MNSLHVGKITFAVRLAADAVQNRADNPIAADVVANNVVAAAVGLLLIIVLLLLSGPADPHNRCVDNCCRVIIIIIDARRICAVDNGNDMSKLRGLDRRDELHGNNCAYNEAR